MINLKQAFPAMTERNFRLFFLGQIISFAGTWLQGVVQGWLIFEITHSAEYIGLVAALTLAPTAILSVFGGIIVDRFDRRKILYVTQIVAMAQACCFGALVITGTIACWHIVILALLLGIINAVDSPARHAFVQEIVSRENIMSASALNSGLINAAQAAGPALAGTLINLIGIGGVFLVNALSFLAVIFTLSAMKLESSHRKNTEHPLIMLRTGIGYCWLNRGVRQCLFLAGVIGLCGLSYQSVLPVMVKNILHAGPKELGYLYSATGAGSLIGAIVISALSKRNVFKQFVLGGSLLTGLSIVLFGMTAKLPLSLLLLFISGFGFIVSFATLRGALQRIVKREMMGRVMSIIIMIFFSGMTLGNYLVGIVAQRYSCPLAIQICGGALVLMGAVIFLVGRELAVKTA